MKSAYTKLALALFLSTMGLAIAAAGIYIGETDDAPGAAFIGIVAALGMIAFAVRMALRKPELP